MYVIAHNMSGQVWNGSVWEAYVTANRGTYDIPVTDTEEPKNYKAVFPSGIAAGKYKLDAFIQAGGTPAETDTGPIDVTWYDWDGRNVVGAGTAATLLLDLANGVETSYTVRQALRLILSALAGKISGASTSTIVIRDVGDSTDRITATVDSDGNRSAVTVDAT
jgi:hypothetical protein